MTLRSLLLAVLASLAAHAVALTLLALTVGESLPAGLVVVLSELEVGTIASGPRQAGAGAPATPALSPGLSRLRPSPSSIRPSPPVPVQEAPAASHAAPEPPVEREAPPARVREPEPAAASAPREEWTAGAARESLSPSLAGGGASAGTSQGGSDLGRGGQDGTAGGSLQHSPAPAGVGTGGAGTSVAVAPSGPRGGEAGTEYGGYYAHVRQRIQESLRYPPAARRRGLKGTVHLEIVIRPDGSIGDVSVAASSSHRLLDEAALETVRGLSPQPFPSNLVPRRLMMQLPVVFELQ